MPLSTLGRDIDGRVAVVTGAGSGIGRAVAHLLSDLGARVAAADIDAARVAAVEAELREAGDRVAKAFVVDLADAAATRRFAQEVLDHFGDVDILVNNAGVPSGAPGRVLSIIGGDEEPLLWLQDEFERDWQKNLAVNLMAQVRLVRAFGPSLRRHGEGRVVNIASTEGSGATLFNTPYVAAKHACVGLTRALAVELASQGVCVNCVQPGPIRTGITDWIPEKHKDTYAKRLVPMRRYGLPEEVAQIVAALCMPAMRWINGAVVAADGGLLANNGLLPTKLPWKEVTALEPPSRSSRL